MKRIIITIVILGVAYYLLSQPTPTEQENKSVINQSTQTYFSPEIGKSPEKENQNTAQEEALLEELINQIKELNKII